MQKSALKEIVKNMISELLDDDATANSETETTEPDKIALKKEKEKLDKISIDIDKLGDEKSKISNTIRPRIDNIDKKLAAEKKKRDDVSKRVNVLQSRLNEDSNKHPHAVFVVAELPNGKVAATTRAIDKGEAGKIGLPGGKLDIGETPIEALKREANEEGWSIDGINENPIHIYIVDGKLIKWYSAKKAVRLNNYKEKNRIYPIEVEKEEIANSGYGNEFLKNYFKLNQKKSVTIDQSVKEQISLTKDTDHLINRIKLAAKLCDKLGDKPLLFRQFRHKEIGQKLIVKVINHGEKNKIKGGINKDEQIKLFDALGVQKPIFCTLDAPGGLEGMHGMSNIVVPPDDFKLYYSDVVVDFGANIVKNENYDQAERITADKFVHTYKTGWPEKSSLEKNHEIILDCDFYYLLDIKSFLVGYFGIGARDMIIKRHADRPELPVSTFANLNRLLFSEKIKTYRDVSVYLTQIVEKIKLGDKK